MGDLNKSVAGIAGIAGIGLANQVYGSEQKQVPLSAIHIQAVHQIREKLEQQLKQVHAMLGEMQKTMERLS